MAQKLILREDRGGICNLTLNRPERLNALNLQMFEELSEHVADLARARDAIGCVILGGAGSSFSAGHDMQDIAEGERPPDPFYQCNIIRALADLPQPVVVAIRGHCYTGALELALAGDFILASETARFADTHAKFGLAPAWGMSVRLPRRIGRQNALEMMMTARTYSAQEAHAMGLVDHLYPDAEFSDRTKDFCNSITRNSWHSIFGYKKLVDENARLSIENGLVNELRNSPGLAPDASARIANFINR